LKIIKIEKLKFNKSISQIKIIIKKKILNEVEKMFIYYLKLKIRIIKIKRQRQN
jgi:hypothetical protein